MAEEKAKPHDSAGHRARLRQRLFKDGTDRLADYEIIEYLLFAANSRGDTKPLAKALLDRFGSLAGVLDAPVTALMAVPGMGEVSAGALRIVGVAAREMKITGAMGQPVLSSWHALLDYLHLDMAHLTVERVRVLYLNAQNRLIKDYHVGDGSVDEAAIHPREVIRRAFAIGATALILVHNHPSGDPSPSEQDREATRRLRSAGGILGIPVIDHVILGDGAFYSFREEGDW